MSRLPRTLRPAFESGWALPVVLMFAWLAATAGLRPLMLPDEGRYVGVAWEMIASGDWLTPTLNGLPFFHKPPLFYWITAASMSAFGTSEWAGRMASVTGGTAGAAALFFLVRRWATPGLAARAVLVLATQPLFFIGSQFANLDMLVAGGIGATICLMAHAVWRMERGEDARWALYGAGLFAALSMLAKGLIGFVLPGAVIVAWVLLSGRWRLGLRLFWPPALLLFAAVALPWFAAMQARYPDFGRYFFVVQHLERFTQSGFNNVQPFWFYPAALALTTLPWPLWLVGARRSWALAAWWRDPERGPMRQLMAVWLGVVVLFFSLPQSKLIGYALPATVPLAYLIADAASSAFRGAWARRVFGACVAVAMVVCVAAVVMLAREQKESAQDLGRTLQAQRRDGEPVVFFSANYYFDFAFHAGLREPPIVVHDWSDPAIPLRDTWYKELLDASAFAPPAARSKLMLPQQLNAYLCAPGHLPAWIVGPRDRVREAFRIQPGAVRARMSSGALVYLQPGDVNCAGTPSAGSAGK